MSAAEGSDWRRNYALIPFCVFQVNIIIQLWTPKAPSGYVAHLDMIWKLIQPQDVLYCLRTVTKANRD